MDLVFEEGDFGLIVVGLFKVVVVLFGVLCVYIVCECGLMCEDDYEFFWVMDFLVVEWNVDEDCWDVFYYLFIVLCDEDVELFSSDLGQVKVCVYDVVFNGFEIGGGLICIYC